MDVDGNLTKITLIFSLVIVNIAISLSIFMLASFLAFGSTTFGLSSLFVGLWDYLVNLPMKILTDRSPDGIDTEAKANELAGWQGRWTFFYWAWWITFTPFVGLFLERISKESTTREYVLVAMIVPPITCFLVFLCGGCSDRFYFELRSA